MKLKTTTLRKVNKTLSLENKKMCSETGVIFPATPKYFYTRTVGDNRTILQPHSKFSRRAESRFV